MPVFSRRRLQTMLDEVSMHLDLEKQRDLVQRLESKRVDQALPAEQELAILWAISSTGDIEVEPEWWGDARRPDAISESLVPGKLVAVEVAAATDNSISPEEPMDRVALVVSEFASTIIKGIGIQLAYRFAEERRRVDGRSVRRVLAPMDYKVSPMAKELVTAWLRGNHYQTLSLRIAEEGLDVNIQWKPYKQVRYHNISTSLPPEAYSLEDNPLFTLLTRKAAQLRAAEEGTVRVIVLGDVGSTLLNRLGTTGERDSTGSRFSARQIIERFMQLNATKVDAVFTISPRKDLRSGGRMERSWHIASFCTANGDAACAALSEALARLPLPRFAGYQARSLFRQGCFSPKAYGWYLGARLEKNMNQTSIRIPARMFLDLMAGRISEKQFKYFLGERDGQQNSFARWLDQGMTISRAEMAPRDLDEEDDHIVLFFSDDPVARPLRVNSLEASSKRDQ